MFMQNIASLFKNKNENISKKVWEGDCQSLILVDR